MVLPDCVADALLLQHQLLVSLFPDHKTFPEELLETCDVTIYKLAAIIAA